MYRQQLPGHELAIEQGTPAVPDDGFYYVLYRGARQGRYRTLAQASRRYQQLRATLGPANGKADPSGLAGCGDLPDRDMEQPADAAASCTEEPPPAGQSLATGREARLAARIAEVLAQQGVEQSPLEVSRFAAFVDRSERYHRAWRQKLAMAHRLGSKDILYWIAEARDTGDRDEALWRGFLAAHFGRSSADPRAPAQMESAARLLCGFEATPMWTWPRVSSDLTSFRMWLIRHADELQTLRFGNHRKYESKRPEHLFEVIAGFVEWVHESGGDPHQAFSVEADDPESRFRPLYISLSKLKRFGRTGAFDLLALFADMELLDVRPESSYLVGSTGPRAGARLLWGRRSDADLERLANEMAEQLHVSPLIMEDALCNWQK